MNEFRVISTRSVSLSSASMTGVGQPNAKWRQMSYKWSLIDDLLGGTDVMRARAELWLPREPKEDNRTYRNRLLRSFLFNGYRDATNRLVTLPFSQPVTLENEGDDERIFFTKNVDKDGNDITQFCKELFDNGVNYGKCHIYVDYPTTSGQETLADERELDLRPIFIRVDPRDLLHWKYEISQSGERKLTEIRFIQRHMTDDGDEKLTLRVVRNGEFETYEEKKGGGWIKIASGTNTITEIPLVTIYFRRSGFMQSEPPLYDLAELNLCHWQSMSDHRNYLRFCRIGMVSAVGLSQDELDQGLTIAPNQLLKSINPDAKFSYVEAGGSAAKIGEEDLKRLQDQMEILGMQPLVARSSMSTARGKMIDEGRKIVEVQMWVRSMENGLREAYHFAAKWLNAELPEDFSVNLFDEFGIESSGDQDFLLSACVQGKITHRTFLKEILRRGVLSDDLDIEKELDEAGKEGMNALLVTGLGQPTTDPTGKPSPDPTGNPVPQPNKPPPRSNEISKGAT
jgi:hypothetical protein